MESEVKAKRSRFFVRIRNNIRRRLIAGILVVVPLWLTYIALRFFFRALDGVFAPLVREWFGFSIPGFGFILLLAFLYLIGMVTTNILGRSLVHFGETILNRIPFVKNIYQGAKQLIQTISLSRNLGFKRVVFIEYPRKGLLAVSFVTSSIVDQTTGKRFLIVFLPSPPNPINGMFVLVPENEVIETNLTIEDGVKLVVSAGMIAPAMLATRREGTSFSS